MTFNRRTRQQMLMHCGELHEDDGVDPREFFKEQNNPTKRDRKALQLCRQVEETMHQILTGEIRDDDLGTLHVVSVVPAPDSSRLLITLEPGGDLASFDRPLVVRKLAAATGWLRCEIAAAITRRKAPQLAFHVALPDATDNPRREEPES